MYVAITTFGTNLNYFIMNLIQLYQNGTEMGATDGRMYIDGRLNVHNAKIAVVNRNKRYAKNFPHKIADAFKYKTQIINL